MIRLIIHWASFMESGICNEDTRAENCCLTTQLVGCRILVLFLDPNFDMAPQYLGYPQGEHDFDYPEP